MDCTKTSRTSKQTFIFCVILLSRIAATVNGVFLHLRDNKTSFQWCIGRETEFRFSIQNVNNAGGNFDLYAKHKQSSAKVYANICHLKLNRGTCSTKQNQCKCTSEGDFRYTWFRHVTDQDGGCWVLELFQSSAKVSRLTVDVINCSDETTIVSPTKSIEREHGALKNYVGSTQMGDFVDRVEETSTQEAFAFSLSTGNDDTLTLVTEDGGLNAYALIVVVISCCCAAVAGTVSVLYLRSRLRKRKQTTLTAVYKSVATRSALD